MHGGTVPHDRAPGATGAAPAPAVPAGADVRTDARTGARSDAHSRVLVIDAMKGAGIALVVLGHAFVGLLAARLAPADGWMAWTHDAIYLFHMPLFFLLSGLFAARRGDDSPSQFLRWLSLGLLWPYLLWSVLQLGVIHLAGDAVNTPHAMSAGRVVALLWLPASQYWFLHALAMFHVLAWVSARLGWQRFWLLGALLLQAALWWPDFRATIFGSYLPYLAWFALGAVLTGARLASLLEEGRQRLQRGWPVLALPAAAAVMFLLQAQDLRGLDAHYKSSATLGAQATGIVLVGLVVLACARAAPSLQAALAWLGRRSMPIFLVHVMVVAGCRIVVMKLAPGTSAEVLLVISTVLGLLLPCWMAMAAQRAGLTQALGFR
jgi:fucose 4-O-acetylase-like acetyltransferase